VLGSGGFDVVVSVGVLHHLHDPAEGFRQVRRIVAANGLLLCYMYSRHGRREDMAVKEFLNEALPASSSYATRADFLRLLNLANRDTPWAFLKSLRYRLRFGPPVVLREMLKSFFTRNLVARQSDTFSNPCEHLYSFGELKNLCAQTGWDILGLAEKGGLPTSPEAHSRRVEMLRRLQQLPPEILYDYFAFYYRAGGFTFFARPV
jgi:SAM-dependent methyltransferase